MKNRIAILDGIRTPFCKSHTILANIKADDLGAFVVGEIISRSNINPWEIDELIMGCVAQPADAANVARVIALKAGLPINLIASTVHRNCASGMESITSAANKILAGEAEIIIAGGTESMSNIPLLFNKKMTTLFLNLMKAKTPWQKIITLLGFRLNFLAPIIGMEQGLTDPVCGLNMGETAEVLAREFHISREEQDIFSLQSHMRATKAINENLLTAEILPIPIPPKNDFMQLLDNGPRENQTMEALQKLKPYFDKQNGTVTVGNSCPITDGAAAVIVTTEQKAKEMGITPLGFLKEYAYAALEPRRMGLGPVYATSKLLDKTGLSLKDFELIELNEAFAAQVLACKKAFCSSNFSQQFLSKDEALGDLDDTILNVNGGAIALGHPVGATGTRLVITLLRELRRRKKQLGLATLCIGGGQGAALALEVE